jgi:hypothetical protein
MDLTWWIKAPCVEETHITILIEAFNIERHQFIIGWGNSGEIEISLLNRVARFSQMVLSLEPLICRSGNLMVPIAPGN